MSELITLNMNTPSVQYLCRKDKRLAKVISLVGPITYMSHEAAPYAFLIHESFLLSSIDISVSSAGKR